MVNCLTIIEETYKVSVWKLLSCLWLNDQPELVAELTNRHCYTFNECAVIVYG